MFTHPYASDMLYSMLFGRTHTHTLNERVVSMLRVIYEAHLRPIYPYIRRPRCAIWFYAFNWRISTRDIYMCDVCVCVCVVVWLELTSVCAFCTLWFASLASAFNGISGICGGVAEKTEATPSDQLHRSGGCSWHLISVRGWKVYGATPKRKWNIDYM